MLRVCAYKNDLAIAQHPSILPTRLEAETLAGAETAEIVSASPWYKRPSSHDTHFTFFLTRSTSFNLTRVCP
ncbi:hypothetical protein O181_092302, partial [Austropuccinia psidii MF-1]|nr:hypothetical protein [Austropuccinia psidii MF-1]